MNLVEKAKRVSIVNGSKGMSKEKIDLALAWLKGEVRLMAVQKVLEKDSKTTVYIVLARALREAYRQGRLK